jgi:hypothetical protein
VGGVAPAPTGAGAVMAWRWLPRPVCWLGGHRFDAARSPATT